jgi:ribose 5-phosphate isomerase B
MARKHNDSNCLTLGGRVLDIATAREIVRIWLETPFEGGRHLRRLEKLAALEIRNCRF